MNHSFIQSAMLLLLLVAVSVSTSDAFSIAQQQPSSLSRQSCQSSSMALHSSDPTSAIATTNTNDDDEEYEYVEYDILDESDFTGSEWLVGSLMDDSPNKIQETWCRLAIDKEGRQVAIWGDNAEGTWKFDKASQFLSMSKNNLLGKKIWAGVVEDYYFLQGTVRGWSFFAAAAVLGQWQGKRLGVDPEEAGTAPWFETQEEESETPLLNGESEPTE